MKIEIICPLYNAEKYIVDLNKNILKQKKVNILNIKYLLTESTDNTEKILKENKLKYELIKKEDFSHSLVREKAAFASKADIVVFITQDIIIEREDWLFELVNPIIKGEAVACYSRQLCKDNSIEKYTREKNYPSKSRIVSKKDIKKLGLNTFFFSDASSAIKKSVFVELNGYDNKNLPISEDMYIAYKIIETGYKIKYCAKSEVVHSHNFTLKEQYDRYKLTGKFFKENSYLDNYGTTKSGSGLAKYILKRAIEDRNIKALLNFIPNMVARYIGMQFGKKENKFNCKTINIMIGILAFIISMIFYYNGMNIIASILLMTTGVGLFCINKKNEGYFTNVVGVFSVVWFFTIGLSTLRLHQAQVEWQVDTWISLAITYIFFNIGYNLYKKKKSNSIVSQQDAVISKKLSLIMITILFALSFGIFILEVVVEGYVPMFSKEMSAYQDFGVGKLHFFTVLCPFILPLSCVYYHLFKKTIKKKEIIYLSIINIISFCIPFLIVSRFFIIMTIILTGFCLMEMNKKKEITIIVMVLILGLIGWVIISNFRNQDEKYLKEALQIQENAPLSTSNMQIYMYVAMNYDNFNYNVNKVEKYSYGVKSVLPIIELLSLENVIPNATPVTNDAKRIIPVYNTYSIIINSYFDLGIIGIAIYMLIIGYISAVVEKLSINNIINILLKSLIKYTLAFSFFVSYFSNKTFVFYIMIILLAKIGLNVLNHTRLGVK